VGIGLSAFDEKAGSSDWRSMYIDLPLICLPNSTKHPTKEKFSTSTPAQPGRLHQMLVVLPNLGKVMTHMELDRGYGGF
jgi:hypothetical protein